MDIVFNYFIFFSGGLALLFSIGHLILKNGTMENYNLAALFFFLGILIMQVGLIINGSILKHPEYLFFHMTLIYLVAPLAYFAYHLVVLPIASISFFKLLYFLPLSIAVYFDLIFFNMTNYEKTGFLNSYFQVNGAEEFNILKVVFIGAGLQIVVYFGILMKDLITIFKRGDQITITVITIIYNILTVISSLAAIAGYATGSVTLIKWGVSGISFIFVVSYLVGQRYPKMIQMMLIEAEKKYYERSLLEGLDVDNLGKKLNDLMESEKLYLQEDLTLKSLAESLAVTPHQLSQLLNDKLSTNFNNFINKYRIDDAKELLINNPDGSVLSIAFTVGFNSKSSFYDAFSRFTGKSPQNYRKGFLSGDL